MEYSLHVRNTARLDLAILRRNYSQIKEKEEEDSQLANHARTASMQR